MQGTSTKIVVASVHERLSASEKFYTRKIAGTESLEPVFVIRTGLPTVGDTCSEVTEPIQPKKVTCWVTGRVTTVHSTSSYDAFSQTLNSTSGLRLILSAVAPPFYTTFIFDVPTMLNLNSFS
jgi:hypothetical protein